MKDSNHNPNRRPREQQQVLNDIKLALVADRTSREERTRGVDPYNSRMGSHDRDAWQNTHTRLRALPLTKRPGL
ncbi:MAG: hypothetical protein ACHQAR_04835 [Steroidobacterales bacterium]